MKTWKNVALAAAVVVVLTSFTGIVSAAMAAQAAPEDVVAAYLAIQEKLAGDSAHEVAASADELAAAARELAKQGKHSKDLQAIAAAAGRMEGADLDALRSAFDAVSRAMVAYAQKARLGLGLGLYYCPMKDAYWLQRGDHIRNPYYGKSMLGCGQKAESVKE